MRHRWCDISIVWDTTEQYQQCLRHHWAVSVVSQTCWYCSVVSRTLLILLSGVSYTADTAQWCLRHCWYCSAVYATPLMRYQQCLRQHWAVSAVYETPLSSINCVSDGTDTNTTTLVRIMKCKSLLLKTLYYWKQQKISPHLNFKMNQRRLRHRRLPFLFKYLHDSEKVTEILLT